MDRWLTHLTMSTGHMRRSYRSEVVTEAITWGRAAISQALAQTTLKAPSVGTVDLPPMGPKYRLACSAPTTKTLLCSVWRGPELVLTFGVAAHNKQGAGLWRWLIETAGPDVPLHAGMTLDNLPAKPWVAARMELGMLAMVRDGEREQVEMLGDLERVIGWAFLDAIKEG